MKRRPGGLKWIKARRCHATTGCVELAPAGDMVALRDSKNPAQELYYTRAEMDAFFDAVKHGEFDHLLS